MSESNLVYIGIGTNLGDKKNNLKNALKHIKNEFILIKSSSIYKSKPIGYNSDSIFFNGVLLINTSKSPQEVFKILKKIEDKLGRIKTKQNEYEDRIIDLDILFFNNEIIQDELITIPHKEIQNRKFVLEPLNEINPELIHPILNQKIKELLEKTLDHSELEQISFKM